MNPKYPIYIISKGRWDTRLTSKALERMNVPYRIVIEPQECEQYTAVIDSSKILILPFSNLGLGSIPARNWVWEHSISEGYKWHWILDDNIVRFDRLHKNTREEILSGTAFKAAEDFVNRYKNIAQAGFQYRGFAVGSQKHPALIPNTRIYSCILINNSIPHRWRGIYNEDTDLSLRVLKDGWCTILFFAFLADKKPTMTVKGGNTDELYAGDGRLKMAQSLQAQHPDVVKIAWKWGRWQHQVDYRPFRKNQLVPVDPNAKYEGINNYGMKLVKLDE